jgi:hypothetical protein
MLDHSAISLALSTESPHLSLTIPQSLSPSPPNLPTYILTILQYFSPSQPNPPIYA